MYIEPNSIVKVLKNIRLDGTYRHTIQFASKSAQTAYFSSKAAYTFDNTSYIRKDEGFVRVPVKADSLYDCNYIMFQNTSFGSKWFYAFIKSVEYMGNEVSRIAFELDVMQTWHFDYTVEPSFVEREHVENDAIGVNLIPENLDVGELTVQSTTGSDFFQNWKIIVAATFDKTLASAVGGYYANVYSGLCFNVFDTAAEVNAFLIDVTEANKADGIVSIFMCPSEMATQAGTGTAVDIFAVSKNYNDLDGYRPKNNKLFTYPYNYLYCTNMSGTFADFKYEYFTEGDCLFRIAGDLSCNPQAILIPKDYKGVADNWNERMITEGFPQCAYATDSYKAWLAQNSSQLDVSMVGNGLSVIGGAASAYASGGMTGVNQITSGFMGMFQTLAKMQDMSTLPPQARGSSGSGIRASQRMIGFLFMKMTLRYEYAVIIDGFFNLYGYAVHAVKPVNRAARKHWTYIKTRDVNIWGNVPVDHLNMVRQVYDSGVTFWRNGDNIGEYTLDNSL